MAVTENIWPILLWSVAALGFSLACSPLLLTPLLDQGEIEQARQLSDVEDPAGIIPKSYSGFITVDKTLGNHLFFWFFPATHDPTAPVVVWLNGGPGVPSTFGLLYENGPIKLKTSTDGDVSYERRENSWTDAFSMLYIDNPVEVGYSYTESGEAGMRTTQEGYSTDLYNFMEQFYIMFPEYLDKELYIGGQSYAGKYVPALAYRIHQEITANNSQLPLTGIYLGGPFFDPETASSALLDYVYALGGISYAEVVRAKEAQADFFENLKYNVTVPSLGTQLSILFPWSDVSPADNYVNLTKAPYNETTQFMTSDVIRTALHIDNVCQFKQDYENVIHVQQHLKRDLAVSVKDKLAVLMDNYKVLIFNGEFDAVVTSNGIDAGLMSTPWSLQAQFNASQRTTWYPKTSNRDPKGFYQHVGQFCRVVIRGAGHQTPHDQPDVTLEMMRHFVEKGCIKEDKGWFALF